MVAAAAALFAVALAVAPLASWDAWQFWTPKARALVLLDGLDPCLLASPAYRSWNADYPFLLPSLEAIDFRFMGFDTQVLHLQFWLLWAGFLTALAALLRPRVPAAALWATLAALAWAPSLLSQTGSARADAPLAFSPLAFFFALAGVGAWLWLETRDPAMLALFGAAAVATKVEGSLYVGLLVLTLAAVARGRARPVAAAGAAILVGILPWRIWTRVHDVRGLSEGRTFVSEGGRSFLDELADPGRLAGRAERIPIALGHLVRDVVDPTAWLVLVPVALAALARSRGLPRGQVALFLAPGVLGVVAMTLVYRLSPLPFDWQLQTSETRVVTSLVLFWAALTPLLLAHRPAGRTGAGLDAPR